MVELLACRRPAMHKVCADNNSDNWGVLPISQIILRDWTLTSCQLARRKGYEGHAFRLRSPQSEGSINSQGWQVLDRVRLWRHFSPFGKNIRPVTTYHQRLSVEDCKCGHTQTRGHVPCATLARCRLTGVDALDEYPRHQHQYQGKAEPALIFIPPPERPCPQGPYSRLCWHAWSVRRAS
jgi:hypothetical protein